MTYIPSCYYDSSITRIIEDLITDGYTSYKDVLDVDKDILTTKCLEVLGEDAYEVICHSHVMALLKRCIKYGRQEDSLDLVDELKNKAIAYFDEPMSLLFEEMSSFRKTILKTERPYKHMGYSL